jgi:hypothetical protein
MVTSKKQCYEPVIFLPGSVSDFPICTDPDLGQYENFCQKMAFKFIYEIKGNLQCMYFYIFILLYLTAQRKLTICEFYELWIRIRRDADPQHCHVG